MASHRSATTGAQHRNGRMKIAIVGSGRMGTALGTIWAKCGHDIIFSYARSDKRLAALAARLDARWADVASAVEQADAILLAVHWSRIEDVLSQTGAMTGKIVLNCCVPLDPSDSRLVLGTDRSGAEYLAEHRPEAAWVGCFNTAPSESFDAVFARRDRQQRPQSLCYGDHPEAKRQAKKLIEQVGFDPVDLGDLANARFVEPFAMVTAVLAYEQTGGPNLTYRFEKLRD
ncbi:NAD(P)-binding domain-containing protein [Cohaesibacter sp. CAU 1516]|uniref:NADPH-dependent F420 reductase n=1 Tax=Cohaesibacter sp. CAU 1516 TaxID=2576038 RepID=UPI002484CB23|nr:NAD(P)-binding domain-containing protein [Cohaesibacter sp. CAU 1516]